MALTGSTRNGRCVDTKDDAGSHHVCIDMSSTSGGSFCTVTGQPNWCENAMPCDVGVSADAGWSKASPGSCPVRHWCVCQWAFASYLQNSGGCDKVKSIVCEATNAEALLAYHEQAASNPHIAEALHCLEQRCGVAPNATAALLRGVSRERREATPARSWSILSTPVVVILMMAAIVVVMRSSRCSAEEKQPQPMV